MARRATKDVIKRAHVSLVVVGNETRSYWSSGSDFPGFLYCLHRHDSNVHRGALPSRIKATYEREILETLAAELKGSPLPRTWYHGRPDRVSMLCTCFPSPACHCTRSWPQGRVAASAGRSDCVLAGRSKRRWSDFRLGVISNAHVGSFIIHRHRLLLPFGRA